MERKRAMEGNSTGENKTNKNKHGGANYSNF